MYAEESGFRAVQVYQGQDVFPMIRQEKPLALLIQVDLPGQMVGWDVLKALRGEKGICTIPTLVFTWHDQELPQEILQGVSAHLQEPVAFATFVDALRKIGLKPTQQSPVQFPSPRNPPTTYHSNSD